MSLNIKFADLNLEDTILDQINKKNFTNPTDIQAKVIPIILENKNDVLAIASTGTGKTAAFGLPIINQIIAGERKTRAIILTPTRELAIQVADELNSYKGSKKLNIAPIYGGQSIDKQSKLLKSGVNIIVGTPGRIIDNIKRKNINLQDVEYFILDEADEMLKMGFIEDIEFILGSCNKQRRILLFSATLPYKIKELSKKYLKDSVFIEVKKERQDTQLITQSFIITQFKEKFDQLKKIIDINHDFHGIVFCRTKRDVDDLTNLLQTANYKISSVHGGFSQELREKAINKFKKKQHTILIATDVAARGIDIDSLTHVINFSLPDDNETYVHRIGRTGRAGKEGIAISLISSREKRRIFQIEKAIKSKITQDKFIDNQLYQKIMEERFIKKITDKIKSENFNDKSLSIASDLLNKYDAKKIIASLIQS